MKSRLTLPLFFYFGCFLSLFLYCGCGDTEDMEKTTNSTYNMLPDNMLPDELDKPWLWEKLKDEDWEKLTDEDWIRLTDGEVKALMNLEIPQRWAFETKDQALRQKYYHATLFQKFGDLPQVRYIVEFERQRKGGILTLVLAERYAAYHEAMYFLFPSAVNKSTLEEDIKLVEKKRERHFMEKLRIEDPEAWVKYKRAALIDRHGDIPAVDTIVNFLRKLELELPRTDEECRAYLNVYKTLYDHINTASTYEFYASLEAVNQTGRFFGDAPLRRLEKYREARAEGIPFYDIDWDDD